MGEFGLRAALTTAVFMSLCPVKFFTAKVVHVMLPRCSSISTKQHTSSKKVARTGHKNDAIRRPRDTPIWKLEASLKCRSCRKSRYAPPLRMIKLTERQEITPDKWVHPDEER
jgi:hypothetical protein